MTPWRHSGITSSIWLAAVQLFHTLFAMRQGSLFWEWTVRKPSETIDVSLPNGLHPYGVSVWDETFT